MTFDGSVSTSLSKTERILAQGGVHSGTKKTQDELLHAGHKAYKEGGSVTSYPDSSYKLPSRATTDVPMKKGGKCEAMIQKKSAGGAAKVRKGEYY